MGEAAFIRGFAYFGLAKRYGGVPIILEPQDFDGDPESLKVPRNTEKETWDFVLDIDSPWFDISTATAKLLVDSIKHHGIESVYVKFSGNKGWHIVVPAEAFPEKIARLCQKIVLYG